MSEGQAKALEELQRKSLQQIQFDTAVTWANRAWAARRLAQVSAAQGDSNSAMMYSHDATEYEHEAIEHAALCGVDEALATVRQIING